MAFLERLMMSVKLHFAKKAQIMIKWYKNTKSSRTFSGPINFNFLKLLQNKFM